MLYCVFCNKGSKKESVSSLGGKLADGIFTQQRKRIRRKIASVRRQWSRRARARRKKHGKHCHKERKFNARYTSRAGESNKKPGEFCQQNANGGKSKHKRRFRSWGVHAAPGLNTVSQYSWESSKIGQISHQEGIFSVFSGIFEGLSHLGKFRHFCNLAIGTAPPSLLQAFLVISQISGHGTDRNWSHRLLLGLLKKSEFFRLGTPPPKAEGQAAGGGLGGMFYKKYRKVYTFLYTCQRSSKIHISRIVYKKVDNVSHETLQKLRNIKPFLFKIFFSLLAFISKK